MEKEIIDGWHRSCAEDLPDYGEIVMCVLVDLDINGEPMRTEEPPMLMNWRVKDEEISTDELGWVEVYKGCKVAYWYRIPSVPPKFVSELLGE